ncbi:MAG: hypothetical protein HRT53_00515 [Colwellia sp.]|nr:hypothetical protein [Colwellia sp.]
MLLLKSLLCFTGFDNRRRFIFIHISSYFLFIITSAIFSINNALAFLCLCIFTCLCTFSTKRRLNDANLNKSWLYAPGLSLFIAGLIIIFTGYSTSYWLLLFPLMISALLTTYKSLGRKHYILGYYGNVDLSAFIKPTQPKHESRIEPTFNQTDALSDERSILSKRIDSSSINSDQTATTATNSDLGEAIRLKLFSHKNALLTVSAVILIIVMAMISTSVISTSDDNKNNIILDTNNKALESQSVLLRTHLVTLPDDFSLFVSSFNGITIKWQGDATSEKYLWQQLSAQGDKSCKEIDFNNGEKIRTLSVKQENNSDYLASFSPLDTQLIIKNIAYRGSFSLCGYSFSLKGSQSVLGKHDYYATFIN